MRAVLIAMASVVLLTGCSAEYLARVKARHDAIDAAEQQRKERGGVGNLGDRISGFSA